MMLRLLPRLRPAALLLCLACGALPAAAQPNMPVNPQLLRADWPASWISHPEAPRDAFGVFHFRKTFELAEAPARFLVHVSGDNRYRLFVNGKAVASGPARGDLEYWNFETLDLGPHLTAGRNVIAAVVWNYAQYKPVAQVSFETAFLMQGDTEREAAVNTGAGWKVLRDDAYAPIPVEREKLGWVYIVVGPGERVDARRYPWGWETAAYDDAAWAAAKPLRRAVPKWGHTHDIYTAWKLVPRTIPLMEERMMRIPQIERSSGVAADTAFLRGSGGLVIPARTRATLLLDQNELVTAYPELTTSGGKDAVVTLTYAEALFDEQGHKGNRDATEGKRMLGYQDAVVLDGGAGRHFRSLWFRTYRYLQLDIETADEALAIDDLYSTFTAYPFEQRAAFASSDASLGRIWEVGWRTARLCANETYYDCPYYEQLQYVGDTRIQALISLYVSGDDRLMRKAIMDLYKSREPDGLTQSRYPSHEQQFIPPFSLYWVAMIHDHWMNRGDRAFAEPLMTGVRGVLDWYARYVDETGMLGPMPAWNFADWAFKGGTPPGAVDGHSAILSLQYAYTLDYAAGLADAFGRTQEASEYRARARQVKKDAYERCWDAEKKMIADTPEKTSFSQHANIMGVLSDAVPEAMQQDLVRRILDDGAITQTTYYYRFYLTRAMKKVGLGDLYVSRLDPWRQMLALGLTTFAEEPEPSRSDCHAWSSSPNYDFLATVCGIEPASAGFRTVRIAPALGALAWAEGRMPHPAGDILVSLNRREGGGIQADVTLPPGVTGVFVWGAKTAPLKSGVQRVML